MEADLQLRDRWQPTDPEYVSTLKYIKTRRYQQALGQLQRLVIQRLFELQKMNLSHTGKILPHRASVPYFTLFLAYRVRTHIAKSLQKRCKAIRSAVKAYNAAAIALDEPRPTLDWSQVSHFSFLEEFTLLNDTRNDIRDKPWGQPLIREAMRTARRIKRATEELDNVHREARRIHTSIADEDVHFTRVLADLKSRGDVVYEATHEFCTRRRANNAHILSYLHRLYALPQYAGETTPGKYCGPARERAPAELEAQFPAATLDKNSLPPFEELARAEETAVTLDEEDGDADMDEDEDGDVGLLIEHIANIALVAQ